MQIYRATTEHLDEVAFLFDRYRMFYGRPSDLDSAKEFIRERLQTRDAAILLAVEGDRSFGYSQLFPSWSSVSMQRVWILNDLYVLPQARNRGIAKALINAARDLAMTTEAVRIILATEVTNTVGQNLYESMGYRKFEEFYHYLLEIA